MNGATTGSNNIRIDGASQYNIWLPHVTAYVPALESIETVNIVTNSFDAEQGLAAGAAVNVQIKSGTNDMHGSALEAPSRKTSSSISRATKGPRTGSSLPDFSLFPQWPNAAATCRLAPTRSTIPIRETSLPELAGHPLQET